LLMERKMYCPACRTELVVGELKWYVTLAEHVMCQEEVPKRETVICPSPTCYANEVGAFWSYDGEGPYTKVFTTDNSKWIDGNANPFNSWHRKRYFNISYHDEDKRLKLTKRWILLIHVTYDSNDWGDMVGKRYHWSFIHDGIYHMNGLRMLIFSIHQFYRERAWKKDAASELVKQSEWPRAEWWRKVAAWWVKVFHKKELAR